jgi:long-chain acyl-CoA synthetase
MDQLPQRLRQNHANVIEYHDGQTLVRKPYSLMYQDVCRVMAYLKELGLKPRDKIGSISGNRYEVVVLDLACLFGGWHLVTLPKEQYRNSIHEAINDFALKLCFADELAAGSCRNLIPMSEIAASMLRSVSVEEQIAIPFSAEETFTTVFTSGSTGTPKAIEVRYKCPGHFIASALQLFRLGAGDKIVVFLPLHQFSSRLYVFGAIMGSFDILLTTPDKILFDLRKCKPTILQGVPYFFDSIYESAIKQIKSSLWSRVMFDAFSIFHKIAPARAVRPLQRIVFAEFHKMWGDRMRILITGAAPIRAIVLQFFDILGMPIYEAYGLVETGLISLSYPGSRRIGSVGKILADKDVRFDADGQIIVRSSYFWGTRYVNASAEVAAEVFSEDECVSTGDAGYLDKDGFLYLTGRVKDVLVLTSGDKVQPSAIEQMLISAPSIKQAAVFGNGKPYLVCVLTLKGKSVDRDHISREIAEINGKLSSYARVNGFVIADQHFSTANQQLTAAMKLNRRQISQRYRCELEALYD